MTERFIFIFEMLGIIATAASGAMAGMKKHMDMLGVGVLAVTAAMGGGIIRDLILGAIPPVAFVKPIYAGSAFAVAAVMFFFHRAFPEHSFQKLHAAVFLYMDAIGLGAFTVVGVQKAITMYGFNHIFLLFTTGFLTGVGGGIMRDIFAGEIPGIFIKHFYACASVIGAGACIALWKPFGTGIAMAAGILVTTALRLCAAHFKWNFFRDRNT